MGKKFTCTSEAQKKAIRANYARLTAKKNVSANIPNGTILHTRDNYLEGADGKSVKGRYVVVLDSNRNGDLGVGKVTHSQKEAGVSVAENFDEKSRIQVGGLSTKDNSGQPIRVSNKFQLKPSKGLVEEHKVNEIKKALVTDKRFGKRNRQRLHNLKGRK